MADKKDYQDFSLLGVSVLTQIVNYKLLVSLNCVPVREVRITLFRKLFKKITSFVPLCVQLSVQRLAPGSVHYLNVSLPICSSLASEFS